ncbi:MAG: serine--tRNA ligase, partial [Rectinemataceae bacterium]
MLDIRFIKENIEAVRQNIADRYMKADADLAVSLHDTRNRLIRELEDARRRRNENAQAMKQPMEKAEREARIEEGRRLKETIAELEASLAATEARLNEELLKIPNMAHPDAPRGKEDKDNLEIKRCGEPTRFDFQPRDHVELGQLLDIIDFDTATRVSGTKFYYLKNEGVLLELALVRYALDHLMRRGFVPMITPDIAKT